MDAFVEDYLERLETLVKNLCEAVEGLPPEALDWEPGPEMNSPAVLLAHTAGSLRFWIGDVALGEPSERVREREFQTRGRSGQELQQRLQDVFAYAQAALPRLRRMDLDLPGPPQDDGEIRTRGWALLHALEHASLHLGHIQLTGQLWKQRAGQ